MSSKRFVYPPKRKRKGKLIASFQSVNMLLRHIFSLVVAASLSICRAFSKSGEELPSHFSEHQERSKEVLEALEARTNYQTERGTIIGEATDTLRTYGLATCVGMVAVGGAGPNGVNKVFSGYAINSTPLPRPLFQFNLWFFV